MVVAWLILLLTLAPPAAGPTLPGWTVSAVAMAQPAASTSDSVYAALVVRLDYEAKLRDAAQALNDQRFVAQEKAVTAALNAAERAVAKAEGAAEKRFEGVNEFRAVLTAQQATFLPRTEFDQGMGSLKDKMDAVEKRMSVIDGRSSGANDAWAWVIAGIGSAVGAIGLVLAVIVGLRPRGPVVP